MCQRHIHDHGRTAYFSRSCAAYIVKTACFVGLFAASAFVTFAAVAAPAFAGDEALRLTWRAPDGCPSGDDVRAAILGEPRASGESRADVLEASAFVYRVEPETPREDSRRDAPTWRVRLQTRRGALVGEREIEASTCSGVAEATAVVLAMALVPPPREDEPPAPSADADVRERPSASAAGGARAERHVLAVGASVVGDTSTLPSAAAGGSLTIAWGLDRLRLELDARRWASQSRALSRSGAGARFSMTSLGGRGCWAALRAHAFELAPCAGADVHLVTADGFGADDNFAPSAAWTTVTGGALGRLSLSSWLALRARVEAFVPLSRPTFVVENDGAVHRPPSLGAAASFGAELLFL